MHRAAPWLLAALLLLTALPARADFHAVAWAAQGVATDGADVYLITIQWGPDYHGVGVPNVFNVTVTDPASGAVVQQVDFLGSETWITLIPISFQSGGLEELYVIGSSLDPGVQFSFTGNQVAQLTVHVLHQELQGSFQGLSFAVSTLAARYTPPP